MGRDEQPRWNYNIHLHGVVLAAVPVVARSALNVGAGHGMLAVKTRGVVSEIVTIDLVADVFSRAAVEYPGIQWVRDDVIRTTSAGHSTWHLLPRFTSCQICARRCVGSPTSLHRAECS